MSATDIIKELSRLTEVERRLLLDKLHELAAEDEFGPLKEQASAYGVVNLHSRRIRTSQAILEILAQMRGAGRSHPALSASQPKPAENSTGQKSAAT